MPRSTNVCTMSDSKHASARENNRSLYARALERDKAEVPSFRLEGPVINLGIPFHNFLYVYIDISQYRLYI